MVRRRAAIVRSLQKTREREWMRVGDGMDEPDEADRADFHVIDPLGLIGPICSRPYSTSLRTFSACSADSGKKPSLMVIS
jgi:hypothetical protein